MNFSRYNVYFCRPISLHEGASSSIDLPQTPNTSQLDMDSLVNQSEVQPEVNDSGYMDTSQVILPDEDIDICSVGSQEDMDTNSKDVWDVSSFEEFNFYCCPECVHRTKTKVFI